MRGTKVKELRSAKRPNPGRKFGGESKDVIRSLHTKAPPPEDRQRKPTKPRHERR